MNLCKIGIHKWVDIKRGYRQKFLGEEYISYSTEFRICENCGKCQELTEYIYSFESDWVTLNKQESKILKSKIKDIGSFYIIKTEEDKEKPIFDIDEKLDTAYLGNPTDENSIGVEIYKDIIAYVDTKNRTVKGFTFLKWGEFKEKGMKKLLKEKDN